MILENKIIDFDLYNRFDLDIFSRYQFLIIEDKLLYVSVACVNKEIKLPQHIQLLFKKPIKIKSITQNELDFELDLLKTKIKMFNFYKQAIKNISNKEANSSFISKFCDEMLFVGVSKNASDIHIENTNKSLKIRLRINGVLKTFFNYKVDLYPMISSILKLFASLDISVSRLPQNGQFSRKRKKIKYDFRISTLPTIYGESIVIRILEHNNKNYDINSLNLDSKVKNAIKHNINRTKGLVLITGATGSGKTTTLYSILNSLKSTNKKIITIEEPVEYNLDFISQVNINNDIGLDYTKVLVNVLRQDPDILMIGEVRDKNALDVALRAALTGHLVLASLHTNNALQTLTRLIDLKAEPFVLSSVLSLIVSQTLIKLLCPNCKKSSVYKNKKVYEPAGCIKCNLSGYDRRMVISEFLQIDANMTQLIQQKATLKEIEEYAKQNGYKSLKNIIYEKFINGDTSLDEYLSHLFE